MNELSKIIDGAAAAKAIRAEVKQEVAEWVGSGHRQPGLATVLVGENPASQSYVKSKQKACLEAGIASFGYTLPASASQAEVEALVIKLNDNPEVNGILVQLPLPRVFDEESVLKSISIQKDVDGFHPINIGRLAQKGRTPLFIPCTPAGIMVLLQRTLPSLEGLNAVVLGRSNIVGMPIALLLLRANSTVTVCHSFTADMADIVKKADIVVAAIGRPEMVKGDWIKPGAVVIDVGINRVDDTFRPKGYRLVGDVAFEEAVVNAKAITPVPGGVGPMTIAMLLQNTMHAAKIADQA